jgi:hypothetical protein
MHVGVAWSNRESSRHVAEWCVWQDRLLTSTHIGSIPSSLRVAWTVDQASMANADTLLNDVIWRRNHIERLIDIGAAWRVSGNEYRLITQAHCPYRRSPVCRPHTARVTVLLNGSSVGLVVFSIPSANAALHQFFWKFGGSWLGSTLTYYDWSLTIDAPCVTQ